MAKIERPKKPIDPVPIKPSVAPKRIHRTDDVVDLKKKTVRKLVDTVKKIPAKPVEKEATVEKKDSEKTVNGFTESLDEYVDSFIKEWGEEPQEKENTVKDIEESLVVKSEEPLEEPLKEPVELHKTEKPKEERTEKMKHYLYVNLDKRNVESSEILNALFETFSKLTKSALPNPVKGFIEIPESLYSYLVSVSMSGILNDSEGKSAYIKTMSRVVEDEKESRKFFIMNESDCRTALAMRKQYLEENLDIIAQRHKILGDELVLVNLTKNALDNI